MNAIHDRCHSADEELTPVNSDSHWYSSTTSTMGRSSATPGTIVDEASDDG
jgi:hypothetical protein